MNIKLKANQKVRDIHGNTYLTESNDSVTSSKLVEDTNITASEFCDTIESSYHDYFPNSLCEATIFDMLGKNISIHCYLAEDKFEAPNNILMNDMFAVNFMIQDLPNDLTYESEMPKQISIEANSSSVTTTPDDNYHAFGRVKVPFRKTVGDGDKIIKTLDKYFGNLHAIVKDLYHSDRIPESILSVLDITKKL